MQKKLYRDEYHKVIGGVCSGLAEYFEIDVTIVRLLFAFTFIIMGIGFIPYIVLWIVLPKKGYIFNNYNNPTVDYKVPPQTPGMENPSQGNPFQANQFGGNPFPNQPFPNQPFPSPAQPKSTSTVGLIFGVILILIGGSILLDDFDIIPDWWDFSRMWPLVLVGVGAVLIFSGQQKKPWEKKDWQQAEATDTNTTAGNATEATPSAENPEADSAPTV